MSGIDQLSDHLGRFRSAPFLFVGAGLSRRYLKLETWEGLLRGLAASTDKPYAYYVTRGDGSLPDIAAALAEEFHGLWWSDDRFAESRDLFSEGLRSHEGPVKVEVARHVAAALEKRPKKGALAKEIALLREAVIDGVITTNYDSLLEEIFDDFRVFVGQEELLFSDAQGVGEIYKIHGSCDRPESLVLTRKDFDQFDARNPYLAAKLLAVFVEHPVIFLGYSLSDPNVARILVSVTRCLTTENLGQLQDRLIFVQWDPDIRTPSFTTTVIALEGFTIPVVSVTVPAFDGVFEALGRVRRQFPARLLRRLKEHIYELVLVNEPNGKLAVHDIDDDTRIDEVEVVFGVGLKEQLGLQGYIGLSRGDLLSDVLLPKSQYVAPRVVEALSFILRSPGNVPIYRYLREAGLLEDDGKLAPDAEVDDRIRKRMSHGLKRFLPTKGLHQRGKQLVADAGEDFATLAKQVELREVLYYAGLIPRSSLNLEDLRSYLLANQSAFDGPWSTAWAKLVCLYDYYAYADIAQAAADSSAKKGR